MPAGECARSPGAPPAPASPPPPAPPSPPSPPACAAGRVAQRCDNIIKSEEDKRLYRGLVLSNGMKVLLVSDPTTDKSAAAMDVNVGYLSDPDELPGLAHFCEHMLFLGTQKYPEENEYNKFLSEHGGSSNASTAADHTTFYFDVLPSHLPAALDIFAQFFVAPLFTESATQRELSAVHSEHEKNRACDTWRLEQLHKSTADPSHPYHKFGTGNRETLEAEPARRGLDVRAALLAFHRRWYCANLMALVVVAQESLDELEALVLGLFGAVAASEGVAAARWDVHPFPPERLRRRALCLPVRDLRSLSVDWPVPDTRHHYRSGPGHYLSHLLGHEGPGSLLSELKRRGWCNSLVGGTRLGARGFGFFGVQVDLTEDGVRHVDDIVELIFQYIAMLRAAGPQRWVWEEQRALLALDFRFRDTLEPRTLAHAHVHQLQEFPMEDVLSAFYLLSEWRPDLIQEMLDLLTPDRLRLAVVAKCFADKCTETEPWYGTKYFIEDIEPEKIKAWGAVRAESRLQLPPPNEFIPQRLDLEPEPPAPEPAPVIIKDSPLMRVWFKQDTEFKLPKAFITLDIVSPLCYASPAQCNLCSLWAALLRDHMQQWLYAAELASLRASLSAGKHGLSITIDGYDDKQALLLEKMLEHVVGFKADPARFAILKENHIRAINNFEAEQPYQHAVYQQALCLSETVWTRCQLLEAAHGLTAEQLDEFVQRALRAAHLEMLAFGNLPRARAAALADRLEAKLPKDAVPLQAQQLLLCREVEIEKGAWYLRETHNSVHKSSCASLYYACGLREPRANVTLELLAQLLSEPCFHVLRTQEQLGYIVFSGVRRAHGAQGLRVLVQSERHPAYLDTRVEAFLDSVLEVLEKMSEEEFAKHRASLAAQRLERPKRLTGRAAQLWSEISSQMYNFDRARLEVAELNTVTKEELIAFYKKHIHSSSRALRKLSVHVVSVAEGGAGRTDRTDRTDQSDQSDQSDRSDRSDEQTDGQTRNNKQAVRISELVEFKSRRRLLAQPAPHAAVPRKGAHCKL